MALFAVSPETMRPTALTLNLIVAGLGAVRYWYRGQTNIRLLLAFAVTATPAAFIGGWATSHILMAHSGALLGFQQAAVSGDPRQNVPAGYSFNPAVFAVSPAYTPRTNPLYYDGLRGRSFWQLDSTVVKYFQITERFKLELRLEMFNAPNVFIPSDPDTGIGSGTMGQSTWVAGGNYGREIQYTGRIHF